MLHTISTTPFLILCDLDILLKFIVIFFDFSVKFLDLIIKCTSLSHELWLFLLFVYTCNDLRTAHLIELDCIFMVLLLILCHWFFVLEILQMFWQDSLLLLLCLFVFLLSTSSFDTTTRILYFTDAIWGNEVFLFFSNRRAV